MGNSNTFKKVFNLKNAKWRYFLARRNIFMRLQKYVKLQQHSELK